MRDTVAQRVEKGHCYHSDPHGRVAELADAQDSGSCVRKDVGVQLPPRPPPPDLPEIEGLHEATGKDRLRYDARMLATFSDWMLGLPSILQVVVAFAVLMAIGATPLLLWLGYAVATTRDAMHADQDRTRT